MPEISAAELDILQNSRKLLDTIYQDPDHGLQVKQAVKKARPDLNIPELAAQQMIQPAMARVDGLDAAMAKLNERLDNDAQERANGIAADALARKMANARDRFKLTDEGVEGMTTLMRDKGIVDPADAAELYVARLPKPSMTNSRTARFGQTTYADVTGFADDAERQKLLVENPDRFLVTEVERFLAEEGIEA